MASSAKKESLSFLLDFYLTDATRRNSTQLTFASFEPASFPPNTLTTLTLSSKGNLAKILCKTMNSLKSLLLLLTFLVIIVVRREWVKKPTNLE